MNKLTPDITGQVFGFLTVVRKLPVDRKQNASVWECRCSCGNITTATGSKLRSGIKSSCGCRVRLASITHNMSNTHEYNCWQAIKQRCLTPGRKDADRYFLKGITICDRWLNSFENFISDMGMATSPKHSIDRLDNSKGYFKENCRWATIAQQNRNYSRNIMFESNSTRKCVADWADELSIKRNVVYLRIKRGWTIERALKTPVK